MANARPMLVSMFFRLSQETKSREVAIAAALGGPWRIGLASADARQPKSSFHIGANGQELESASHVEALLPST